MESKFILFIFWMAFIIFILLSLFTIAEKQVVILEKINTNIELLIKNK